MDLTMKNWDLNGFEESRMEMDLPRNSRIPVQAGKSQDLKFIPLTSREFCGKDTASQYIDPSPQNPQKYTWNMLRCEWDNPYPPWSQGRFFSLSELGNAR